MDRVLRRELEDLGVCQRDPDGERLRHALDSSRERSVSLHKVSIFSPVPEARYRRANRRIKIIVTILESL